MKPSYEELERKCERLERRVQMLEDLLKKALEHIAELEEKLGRNSRNSSKPPSTDQKGNTKKSGPLARKSHPGKARDLYPPERVNQYINCELKCCSHCSSEKIQSLQEPPVIWQQAELPSASAIVTQFNCLRYQCQECGRRCVSSLPKGVPYTAFGPKLMALICALTGRYHLAKREAMLLVGELFGIELSEGSVVNIEEIASRALEATYKGIRLSVTRGTLTRHFDETMWRRSGKRQYAWIATNAKATYYRIDPSRSQKAFLRIVGNKKSPTVTDRYNVYQALEGPHQYCFAHLIRDFHAFAEKEGEDRRIGGQIEEELRGACKAHGEYREGKISKEERNGRLAASQEKVESYFNDAIANGSGKLAKLCEKLSDESEHLWAFCSIEGMEPTNNAAERDLRKLVLWRRKSYGTRSRRGNRYVERVSSVIETLKKRGQNILQFMEEAIQAFYCGRAPPGISESG